jgi:hypothetical protein
MKERRADPAAAKLPDHDGDDVTQQLSLIEFIRRLLSDAHLQQDFKADPQGTLKAVGLDHMGAQDVKDALTLVHEDSAQPVHHQSGHQDHDRDGKPAPEPHHHETAAQYVNRYIDNTFEKHTTVDNSFHQTVDTHGGNFDQELDYHPVTASGHGAVAAGGDIRDSTITSGHDNQIGDGNIKGDGNVVGSGNHAVTGAGNTTGFGAGAVSSTHAGGDLNVGNGAAFASGGSAAVNNSDNSLHNSNNSWTDASTHDSGNTFSDNSVHDSGNTSTDASQHHSGNTDVDTHLRDSFNTHTDNSQTFDFHH